MYIVLLGNGVTHICQTCVELSCRGIVLVIVGCTHENKLCSMVSYACHWRMLPPSVGPSDLAGHSSAHTGSLQEACWWLSWTMSADSSATLRDAPPHPRYCLEISECLLFARTIPLRWNRNLAWYWEGHLCLMPVENAVFTHLTERESLFSHQLQKWHGAVSHDQQRRDIHVWIGSIWQRDAHL